MRTPLVLWLALPLAACGRDDARSDARTVETANEPDPIVLRIPRGGGQARAALYQALDSVIWRSAAVPGFGRVLGFDAEAGILSFVTSAGSPARLDLRLARSTIAAREPLLSLTAGNGSDIFGVDRRGRVTRLTTAGRWTLALPTPARSVFPQPDGSAIVASVSGEQTTLWRIVPPDDRLLDTTWVPPVGRAIRTQAGDRVYFTTDTALIGVAVRDLEPVPSVRVRGRIVAVVPTPSGDRLYVATAGASRVRVVRRYSGSGIETVQLPRAPADLRMDPLGRYVLARDAASDSAWVVAIGTDRVIATVRTRWTADLPAVAPDGAVAVIDGADVAFIDPESMRELTRVRRGASDFWVFFFWNGFRPRAPGLDQPVSFATTDTTIDSLVDAPADSARVTPSPPPAQPAPPPPAVAPGFTVSFAALLSADRARAVADSIAVDGVHPRVIATARGSATVYRVILGPYPTRDEAEAIGRAARREFWVYEGGP